MTLDEKEEIEKPLKEKFLKQFLSKKIPFRDGEMKGELGDFKEEDFHEDFFIAFNMIFKSDIKNGVENTLENQLKAFVKNFNKYSRPWFLAMPGDGKYVDYVVYHSDYFFFIKNDKIVCLSYNYEGDHNFSWSNLHSDTFTTTGHETNISIAFSTKKWESVYTH